MKSLTAKEFKEIIKNDPSWAKSLQEPVEIRTYINLDNSNITHLSPFLRFTGRDKDGNVASFKGCSKLQVAEGTFDGFVDFGVNYDELELNLQAEGGNQDDLAILNEPVSKKDELDPKNQTQTPNGDIKENKKYRQEAREEEIIELPYACPVGIKSIGNLNILRPNNKGYAVDFTGCIYLKEYTGKYPGHVDIGHNDLLRWLRETSGGPEREQITIKNLEINGENNKGLACTIHNSLINKLTGKYDSAIRLIGSEVARFGRTEESKVNEIKRLKDKGVDLSRTKDENPLPIELYIKPNVTGTKIELKNNSYPSTINVIGFAKDFPFEAHELELPRTSSKKNGDPLTELRDMLKIKKAMLTTEPPQNTSDPWHKQIKRFTVRTLAQCLQADDILKKQGHQAASKPRLSNILKSSILIATIVASFGFDTLSEVGKKIRENLIINPTAEQLQDFTSQNINKELIKKFLPMEPANIGSAAPKSKNEPPLNNNGTDKLEIIINRQIEITNSCPDKDCKSQTPQKVTSNSNSKPKTKKYKDAYEINLASL